MADQVMSTGTGVRHQPVVATGRGLHVPGETTGGLAGAEVTGAFVEGADLWVLVDHRQVHRVTAGGSELVAGLANGGVGSCLIVYDQTVWVGGQDAALWRREGSNLEAVASFWAAPSRDDWSTPWGGPPAVFSMAAHGPDLYVGVHVGGILRSSDGGRSWTPTIDLHDDVHQVTVDGRGTIWAATGMRGLAESTDRGATWRYHTAGLHGTYLLAVAASADGVLVGASSGHAAGDGALYRLDGERFERCGDGLPGELGGAVNPRHLAAAGDDAAVALPGGDVYASGDGGRSWAQVAEALPPVSEVCLRPVGADH